MVMGPDCASTILPSRFSFRHINMLTFDWSAELLVAIDWNESV